MKKLWSKLSIRWSMILLFLGISLISMILVGVFSHINYSRAVKEDFHTVTDEAAKRLQYHLEFYFDQVSQSTRTMANSPLIQQWMEDGAGMTVYEENDIEAELRRNVVFHYPETVGLFLKSTDRRFLTAPSFSVSKPDYQVEPWYSLPVPEKTVLMPTHNIQYPLRKGMPVVSILTPVYSETNLSLIGCFIIDLSLREIETTMERSRLGQTGQFMLLSQDGTIVYHANKDWRGLKLADTSLGSMDIPEDGNVLTERYEGKEVLVSTSTSPVSGWKVVAVVPFDEMAKGLYTARNATVSAFGIIALLVILIIPSLSNLFVKPILRLNHNMNQVAKGNYAARAEIRTGPHEFNSLNNSFNLMVGELDRQLHLIADLKLQELQARLRQKEAHIQALQNQINPHLLYNSLDVIKSIGFIHHDDLVVRMAGNLADVYRYMAQFPDQEVRLEEELAILDKYLDMAQIRFPGKFQSKIEVEPRHRECLVVKLILQPLAENAVKYAVKNGSGTVIAILIREDGGDLLMDVEDNGGGIPDETQRELVRKLAAIAEQGSGEGIVPDGSLGLANVHGRLFLKYGPPYGLILSSSPGGGTRVTVRLPLVMPEVKKSENCVTNNWPD